MLLAVPAVLLGCSVGMALHGDPEPNLGALQIGQDRDLVLLHLGQPAKMHTTERGRIDVFELQRGNAPSGGRALGHAVMDVLTLGVWEVFGTPIEAAIGEKFTLTVEYDQQGKVTKIASGMPSSAFN
jgi:hypothetical protein